MTLDYIAFGHLWDYSIATQFDYKTQRCLRICTLYRALHINLQYSHFTVLQIFMCSSKNDKKLQDILKGDFVHCNILPHIMNLVTNKIKTNKWAKVLKLDFNKEKRLIFPIENVLQLCIVPQITLN